MIDSCHWAREPRDGDVTRRSDLSEAQRWVTGYHRIAESATDIPDTHCVYISDWESNMMSLMHRVAQLEHRVDRLVHCRYDRILHEWGGKLNADVVANKPMGRVNFHFRHGRDLKAGNVIQQPLVKGVKLKHGKVGTPKASRVIAREVDIAEDGGQACHMAPVDQLHAQRHR